MIIPGISLGFPCVNQAPELCAISLRQRINDNARILCKNAYVITNKNLVNE